MPLPRRQSHWPVLLPSCITGRDLRFDGLRKCTATDVLDDEEEEEEEEEEVLPCSPWW
jgi:uncharacterized protein YbbK (DUF523 family)